MFARLPCLKDKEQICIYTGLLCLVFISELLRGSFLLGLVSKQVQCVYSADYPISYDNNSWQVTEFRLHGNTALI